jgi:peptidoglycan hydrolase-like protein with peptidoglycan-binding domain
MQAARAEAEAVRPEAPARPAQRSAAKSEAAAPKAEIMKTEAPAPAKADKKRDPIGQLLGVGETAPAETPDKNVLAAQRALQKLGYVVKPDGLLGGGTRQAIEKFERDNHLPPKGEVNARLMKALAARAGVAAR